jgi:Uma2 family endonuclease
VSVHAKVILEGAPDMVVEVWSPSNSPAAVRRYRRICFEHGTRVFRVVDPADNVTAPGTFRIIPERSLAYDG